MGIVFGFAPWIVYWILVGNTPLLAAALVAFVLGVAGLAVGYLTRTPRRSLEIGSATTFLIISVLTVLIGASELQRWALAISFGGALLTVLVGRQFGASFVHEYAAANQPPSVVSSDVFGQITTRLTWLWVAVLATMTLSSLIPPIVAADASIADMHAPVDYIGYWIVPATLFGFGALATRILPDWMTASAGDIERKTTFVAYHEATIDELYYLAQEHANREVGAGEEAYAVKVGSKGTALVGDETRHSWPSTYKVRQSRR
ncbi:hypothetical protein [Mycobacterium paraterrae]|uniref:Uncharacterized protein n=1 Tax=Mycobacterium paraterrae TaxID=577492 RepID=A0ABY3VS88_9MYCO|nr:hypothetical protein [Mycobacterium paraterrae]UMB72010.1 hypothetical protein MKK62_12755 [Mycobacterium paraterrae]